jgi:hypothetical protein
MDVRFVLDIRDTEIAVKYRFRQLVELVKKFVRSTGLKLVQHFLANSNTKPQESYNENCYRLIPRFNPGTHNCIEG